MSKSRRAPDGDYDDFWQDPSTVRWVKHVLEDMAPKMEGSALVCSLLPGDKEGDVKFWVELGASIMMDKPIIAIAFDARQVPRKLRRIADEVVILPRGIDPEGSQELMEAIQRVMERTNG